MAEGTTLTPTEYIQHHLTFLAKPVREGGGFWTVHWDTIVMTLIIGAGSLRLPVVRHEKGDDRRALEAAGFRRAHRGLR